MLLKILSNPKRLFVCIALLFLYGLYSGFNLPISMYPATSKPSVNMWVPYGTYSAEDFQKEFGNTIESRIKKITNSDIKVDKVDAYYEIDSAYYEIEFAWNTSFDRAKKEVELVSAGIASLLPKEIADRIGVWQRNKNSGFFAASLYSPKMNLRELYNLIDPILKPELELITDAEKAIIWNPEQYIISIRLIPEKMAAYGIFPSLIKKTVRQTLASYSGSSVKFGQNLQKFEIEANVKDVHDLSQISIAHNGKIIYLKDVADIDFGRDLHRERNLKTNGVNSLILFAKPKSGANVKKMSENILKILKDKKTLLPDSIQIKVIVDPATTISKSVVNLIKDVVLAACMAVLVLFLFIGGIKNIGTAVIEIPLSMVLSFILMNYAGMNLNLISLGGLALAAGMNVDASIVIMENIFKHRNIWAKQNRSCDTFLERIELVYNAVHEVAVPVMLSIVTTLIVFIPMAFTSDLTNAILGDLARAVIFSHAISGIVAIVVVPSVRVLVLKNYNENIKAPLETPLKKFEAFYEKILIKLLSFRFSKNIAIALPLILVGLFSVTILPELPKEVIGKPGTDWVYMYINDFSTRSGRHMENLMQEVEDQALTKLGGMVDYTWFEKHNNNGGQIMYKLFDRKDMKKAEDILKEAFINTSDRKYRISTWNPASLPLPKENHFKVKITGSDEDIYTTTSRLRAFLKEQNIYDRVRTNPNSKQNYAFVFTPHVERWKILNQKGYSIDVRNIADISQLTKEPVTLGALRYNKRFTNIKLSLSDDRFLKPELLKSYPIKIGEKIIPLSALGTFRSVRKPGERLVRNQQPLVELTATIEKNKKNWESIYKKTLTLVNRNKDKIIGNTKASIEVVYPQQELKDSLAQLSKSLAFSLLLIFFVLWLQFQSVKQVSIIMMTIPLGVIGVLLSLYAFDSFLSLNSALGIILLNGITVNNSILITDVTNTLRDKGLRGQDLIISAAKKRLRPILITSLTTILGMFPVALGLGDGGKILQPLGIAVTCGLFIATGVTIFIVPVLLYRKEDNLVVINESSVSTPIEFESENRPVL
jgi:multidrug efflux pump subunit AcrB